MDTCNAYKHVLHMFYTELHSTFKPSKSVSWLIFSSINSLKRLVMMIVALSKKECSQHSYELQKHSAIYI